MADLDDIYEEIRSSLFFSMNDGMSSWDKERGTYALDWTDDDIPMILTWKGKEYFLQVTPREVPCAACGQPGNSDEMMSTTTMAGVDHGGYLCGNIDGCNKRIAQEEEIVPENASRSIDAFLDDPSTGTRRKRPET